MIVSILIDQWRIGDIGFTGWSYYMLADRCAKHGWRLITEERYRDWVPEHPETSDAVGGQPAWSYTYTGHEREIAEGRIVTLPEAIFDTLEEEYGDLAVNRMQTRDVPELESALDAILDSFAAEEPIEALVTYPKMLQSISTIAARRGIPTFVYESSPMRNPVYED